MTRLAITSAVAVLMGATLANAAEPIALRDMGSFHVGGRLVEISGKPVKEVTFTPGGVPAKVDPNGTYQVEQMYVQYFLPANEKGAYPLLMWHGGGLTGVTYETTPDGREGWLNYFLRKGWAVFTVAGYGTILGRIKHSPIVQDAGSSDQWTGGVGVAYTF